MGFLSALSRTIDRLNRGVGWIVFWTMLIVVLVGALNTIARKVGSSLGMTLTSNGMVELQWYLFAFIFLLGAAYTLEQNAHVRVDVAYDRFGPKTRAWINLIGHFAFLIPFCLYVVWSSIGPVSTDAGWEFKGLVGRSWAELEVSPDPGGLWRYPVKTLIPIAFALLALQGISESIKQWATIRGVRQEPTGETTTQVGL